MSFFYDLNKKLDSIRATPEVTHQQLNERDMSRAAKGYEKYGKQGMEALAKAGREGKALDPVRKKYDKYDNDQVSEESNSEEYSSPPEYKGGKYLPPVVDRSRPADKPNVEKRPQSGKDSSPPEWKGKYLPPVDDRSRSAKEVDESDFGPGRQGPNKNQAGPNSINPDFANYKTPNFDKDRENTKYIDKEMGDGYSEKRWPASYMGAMDYDATGQNKYVNRTAPGVINKIKDKLGLDMPDPAYGPRPDERERLIKRYPAPTKESAGPAAAKPAKPAPAKPSKPAPKGEFMGTIKGGVWTADPPKPGQKGVPAPSGDPEGVKEAGAPMTAKQKSFAKLAPPANKITFADKIAGAKKEVDEMLGDVAAEAMRSALGGGRGRNAEMDEERSKGTAFDLSTPRATKPKVGSIERGHKHDIKHTATGRIVTRRTDDQGNSVGADDDSDTQAGPRGRGRPKGTKGAIGAKGPSGRSKLMTKEGEVDIRDQGEYDQEGDMAKDDIKTIVRHAQALSKVLGDNDNLPEWVQSKLAKIEGMMISIDEYMQNQAGDDSEEPIAEKAVSKQQQKFMGMAHAMQKGEKVKGASKELKKVAKTMKPKDTEDFAKTKHKGLPDKVKKEEKEVDESTTSGSVATSTAKPAKSGGMSFGKGIYDSFNRDLEQMISESMSINMSDSTEGNKSLTVTATDDDAMKLAMILKSAGLGGGDMHGDDMHGHMVDENAPDYPTNTQTSNDALQYAGGLNKPKADIAGNGQSTVPVVATRPQNEEDALRRMMEMAGLAEAAKPDFLDLDKDNNKDEPMKDAADDVNEEEDTVEESIQRMREMAGIREAKKTVDEEKTEEGNLFTAGLEDDDVKIGDKIPGTNAIKKKDIDESIFALTNQWQAYKG